MKALAWETVVSGEARRDLTQAARASFETTGLAGKSTLRAPRRMVSSRRMASCAQGPCQQVAAVTTSTQFPYLRQLVAERPSAVQHLEENHTGGPHVYLQRASVHRTVEAHYEACALWRRSSAARCLSGNTREANTSRCRRLARSVPSPQSRLPPPSL